MLKKLLLGLAMLGLAMLALAAAPAAARPLELMAGIAPVGYLTQRLTGPLAQVEVLVGAGQSPHTFEPTPRQVATLASAQAYLSAGLPFEERLLAKAKGANPSLKVWDTIQGLSLRSMEEGEEEEAGHHGQADHQHEAGELDPHVWLSPRLAAAMAVNIARGLCALDPDHAGEYQANLATLTTELNALDQRLAQALAPLKGSSILVFHPAFGYLAQAYGLKQIAVETGGKEPGARQLANLIERAKREGVRVIFVQPQFPRKSAEQVARAIDGVVVPLDPLAPDCLRNLQDIARQLLAHPPAPVKP